MAADADRVSRTSAEYVQELRDQLELLGNAARAYDQGSAAEAKNLAIRLRVLLHDGGGRTRSLLGQLGVRDRLPYMDTAPPECPPGIIVEHAGLCRINAKLGPGGFSRYVAPLETVPPDHQHPPTCFVDWWRTPVVSDHEGNPFSRETFVLTVANQDGGGHVDRDIDRAYARVSREGLQGFFPAGASDPRMKNLALPSVRQIAFELDRTLTEGLVEDAGAPFGFRIPNPICPLSIHTPVQARRNDPCPCGSGKKVKRCFGLREQRRRVTLSELTNEAV